MKIENSNSEGNFVEKIVNIPKLILRLWLILWFVEFICIISKVLFHIWSPIIIENKTFQNICDFIDKRDFISVSVKIVFYVLSSNIIFLTAIKRKFYKNCNFAFLINLFIILTFIISYLNNKIGIILELAIFILLPILHNIKSKTFSKVWKNVFFPIAIYFLISLWQLNMLFIRDVDDINNLHFAIAFILQIDYYIFILITWLGVNWSMGLWGPGLFWSEKITQLEAKKKKLEEKIKLIDCKIEELKAKSIKGKKENKE